MLHGQTPLHLIFWMELIIMYDEVIPNLVRHRKILKLQKHW